MLLVEKCSNCSNELWAVPLILPHKNKAPFPHLEQALSEFFRALRPGGKVGITVAQDLDALSHWYGEHITGYHKRYQFPLHAGSGKGSRQRRVHHERGSQSSAHSAR